MSQNFWNETWRWIMRNGFAAFCLCVLAQWVAMRVIEPLADDYRIFIKGVAASSASNAQAIQKLTDVQGAQAGTLKLMATNMSTLLELVRQANNTDGKIIENQNEIKRLISIVEESKRKGL